MCWTVGISPWGVGPTGRGNSFPLPCLSRSNHLASRRSHPGLRQGTRMPRWQPPLLLRLWQGIPGYLAGSPYPARACGKGYPYTSAGSPHPARACGAPPPPPLGWWQCLRYQVGRRAQEHGDHRHGGLPRRARAPPAGRGHRCWRVEKGPDRYSRRPHAFAAGTLKKDTLPAVTPSQACRRRSAAGAVLSARGAGSRPGPRRCSAARLSPRR